MNYFKLEGQLLLLPQIADSMGLGTSIFDVIELDTFFQSHGIGNNIFSERSFCALKRVNTLYLRQNNRRFKI